MISRRWILLGGLGLLAGSIVPASALRIKLDAPGIAFKANFPRPAQEKIMAVLNRKDCTFVDGTGINSFTTIHYRGTPAALNGFLAELAACPGTTLSVSLKKLPEQYDWRLSHEAHGNRFHAQVNLSSPRLDLEQLVIPELRGPAAAK